MLRVRKSNALLGAAVLLGVLFLLFLVLDTLNLPQEDTELQKVELKSLETKLRSLENDLLLNQKTIDQIRDTVQSIKEEQIVIKQESKAIRAKGRSPVNKTFASIARQDYEFAQQQPMMCDIRMADVYDKLAFDNPDGGAWKQGFDVSYKQSEVSDTKNKLKVFVVPHSHNDPGWIKTFDKYFEDQTRHILDNMVDKLTANPKMKFIWAEVSFLAAWWNLQPMDVRKKVFALLNNGQLEIVTGGWVMNDEANSYIYGILEQLITGHEWLNLNLNGYKPNNGWAIDPFGMSSTMAYFLKRIGFDAMLIQRTHYSVKKHLAMSKDLEFRWRQHWDHGDSTDMMTHMMPFYSYDVPHTCGPDPKVCCQFDFDRLPGGVATCPWRVPPKPISRDNVAERATTLLDQYRKKSQLYKTNTLLVPLGDDFRYNTGREWDRQSKNYEQLMDYVNSNPSMNAEIHFGTLEDYFSAVRDESKASSGSDAGMFKTLSGDFFSYADRDDHYWTGYFTSRPFYKNMDRVLQGYLRGAEILYSMMWAEMEYVGTDVMEMAGPLMQHLIIARQNVGLFQHHDAVTGTAKTHVVEDYGRRLMESVNGLQTVMSRAAHYLLTSSKTYYKPKPEAQHFNLDENRDHHFALPKQFTLTIDHAEDSAKVVIYNSHARRRSEVVTVKISNPDVKVYRVNNVDGDDEEEILPSQLSPVFDEEQGQISNTEFQLSFLAQVKGFALQMYYIKQMRPDEGQNIDMDVAHIRIHNSAQHPYQVAPFEEVEVYEVGSEFNLQNGYVRAAFSGDGILQSVTTLDDKEKTDCRLDFVRYGTRARGDKSGAYLFLPDGPARAIKIEKPLVRVIEGKILSYVEVHLGFAKHVVTLKSSPGVDGTGLQIDNEVDITKQSNFELAMRLSTSLNSGEEFFTDLNGFQMIKRRRMSKLPLQANYYPVPSMAYIQDETSRLSLVTHQPLGGSSMAPGQLEIMLDRRLNQDDNRGVGQGVLDNVVTPNSFYLLLERKTKNCKDEADDPASSYPSLLALAVRHSVSNPYFRLLWTEPSHLADALSRSYEPMDKDQACDIHVVNLRTMQVSAFKQEPADQAALIVHRQGFNACYKPVGMTCSTNGGKLSLEELFPELYSSNVKQMSLSLLYDGLKVEKGFTVSIKPMELYSFLLRR